MRRKFLLYLILLLIGPAVAFGQVSKQAAIPKISFDFLDADLKNVLRVLSEVSKKNIVIAEDVKGKVTIKLDNVSFDEALDAILKNYELAKIEDENILRIVPSKKYYDERDRDRKDRVEFLKEKEARQKLEEEFITETVFINYADAQDVEKMIRGEESKDKKIKGLLSANGAVTMVKWTNALIIKDTRDNVQEITKRIKEHDVPPAQIQIEARIVQASTDFSKELGIQWGGSYKTRVRGRDVELGGMKQVTDTSVTAATGNSGIRDTTVAFPYNLNLPAAMGAGGAGGLGIFIGALGDSLLLDVQLSALESSGKGKIVSNPKVITSDNQPAKISQGQQIPYQIQTQNGPQTEFKDAVLSLEVTPHVTKDGNIRLKIKATKDRPIQILGSPIPGIDKKEAVSEVLIKDGDTAVLGGIYEAEDSDGDNGLPFLKNLPLLGWLFKSETKTNVKRELLIFITPVVLKNQYRQEG